MRITKLPIQIAESLLSIVGIRVGTEEPHYISTPITGGVEVRRYGPRIAADTTVAGDEDRARNIGFRRLANYIFGANHRDEAISMTAPVAQQSDRRGDDIAMTAPVAQARTADDRWTIRFFMPSKWTMDTLPTPDDDNVRLVSVPGESVAVLRFSGARSANAVATARRNSQMSCATTASNRRESQSPGSTIRRGRFPCAGATKSPFREDLT